MLYSGMATAFGAFKQKIKGLFGKEGEGEAMDERLDYAIEQLRQGEQQGFQVLYDQTHNYVMMQARSLLKNDADVHDLVQEVYFNAYRSIDSLQENKRIYAWLGGIAFRQATKLLRKQKDVLVQEEEAVFGALVDLDEDVQPEQALQKRESAQIVKEMLEELPELQKAALLAYYYDEMSVREIAEVFSCSEGTVKSRLNYARKNLKQAIQEREAREGIKLHSLSLPLLLLVFQLWAEELEMDEGLARELYKGSCERIGKAEAGTSGKAGSQPLPKAGASGKAGGKPPAGSGFGVGGLAGARAVTGGIKRILTTKAALYATIAVGVAAVGAGAAGIAFQNGYFGNEGREKKGRQMVSPWTYEDPFQLSQAIAGFEQGLETAEQVWQEKQEEQKEREEQKKKKQKEREQKKREAEAQALEQSQADPGRDGGASDPEDSPQTPARGTDPENGGASNPPAQEEPQPSVTPATPEPPAPEPPVGPAPPTEPETPPAPPTEPEAPPEPSGGEDWGGLDAPEINVE